MQNIEPSGYLEKASRDIEEGNYSKAFKNFNLFIVFLEKDADRKILDIAYSRLYDLLENISSFSLIEKSVHDLLRISEDPYFAEKQQHLAFKIAKWHYKEGKKDKKDPLRSFTIALLYIGKAASFPNVSPEIHNLASRIFRVASVQLSMFQDRLWIAAGKQDKEEMLRLKENLTLRFQHIPCEIERDAFIHLFDKQINSLILTFNNMGDERLNASGLKDLHHPIKHRLSRKALCHSDAMDISDRLITARYKMKLEEFRQFFADRFSEYKASNLDIRTFQKEVSAAFIAFIGYLLRDAFAILGNPPCHYDLRAMGSLAREEICLYSDLEWCILIKDKEKAPYFVKLARLLELQIAGLGEVATTMPIFTCLAKLHRSGLHIDTGGNPAEIDDLINTPELLAKQQAVVDFQPCTPELLAKQEFPWAYKPDSLVNTLRKTISLDQSTPLLFEEYLAKMHEYLDRSTRKHNAAQLLSHRLKNYDQMWNNPFQLQVDLKKHYMELLHHLLNDFSLYFEIDAANTLDVIDELVKKQVFTKESGILLKEAVSTVYAARVDLHLKQKEQAEVFPIVDDGEENQARQSLEKTYWLVLRPIYRALRDCFQGDELSLEIHFQNFDLLKHAFFEEILDPETIEELIPLIKHLVHHSVKDRSVLPFGDFLALHKSYYLRLSIVTFSEPLREAYLKTLELYSKDGSIAEIISYLASLPNPSGFRQAHRIEQEKLQKAIVGMATTVRPNASFKAKIRCPALPNGAYLKEEIVQQIFNEETGGIKSQYKGCAHSVAQVSYIDDRGVEYSLHFKQKPTHPLMEYAIHTLTGRIAGRMTPATQLARFEVSVNSKKQAYPVLISQTVHGNTLEEIEAAGNLEDIDPKQLTWACLSAILTRPGDGRRSNYLVERDTMRIFCVDNDISFMEPLTTSFFTKTINFSSALFCLDPKPLDPSVLEAFVVLSPGLILDDWSEKLVEIDRAYRDLRLFTEEEEERLYDEENENPFKAKLLLRKGSVLALLIQFHHLQDTVRQALKQKKPLYPLDLLKSLVTLRNTQKQPLGPYIHGSYQQAIAGNQSVKERWKKAVNRNIEVSMSFSQTTGANFGKLPTFEEIQNREEFSPEKAREELIDFFLSQCTSGIELYTNKGKEAINADFCRMVMGGAPDKELQQIVLKALTFWIESKGIQAHELTLTNCAVLDAVSLKPFLQKKLELINLSGCPLIKEDVIQEIEKECPSLKKLYLNRCSQLQAFEKPSLLQQKRLQTTDRYLRLFSPNYLKFPKLEELQLSRCKMLSSICLDAPSLKEIKIDKNPLLSCLLFKQIVLYSRSSFKSCPQLNITKAKKAGVVKLLSLKESTPPTGVSYKQIVQLYMHDSKLKKMSYGSTNSNSWNLRIHVFADALALNKTLQKLSLTWNNLGDQEGMALAGSIANNRSLKYLNLYQNNIGDKGAKALAKSIANSPSLEYLNLDNNKFGDKGAKAFARTLLTNKSLKVLNLGVSWHHRSVGTIGDEGARALAEGIASNHSLEQLLLAGQNIQDKGAKAFARAFSTNATLKGLCLTYNKISKKKGQKLVAASKAYIAVEGFYPWDEVIKERSKANGIDDKDNHGYFWSGYSPPKIN